MKKFNIASTEDKINFIQDFFSFFGIASLLDCDAFSFNCKPCRQYKVTFFI